MLEAEWNTKLRELEEARAIEEQYNQSDQHQVSVQERAEIGWGPRALSPVLADPKTTVRERKRAVRLLIEDVTVHKADQIVAHLRFKGGATQTITVPLPPPFAQSRLTAPRPWPPWIACWRSIPMQRSPSSSTSRAIAPLMGSLFESIHVYQLRRHHGIPDRYARLRAQGMLTAEELARNSGVSAQVIWRRYHQGRIVG